ncbi:MAG: hypothetical protein ACJ73N_07900 [Bryobacteraceae bacterium]
MLFAAGGLAFITFLTFAFVGVADARAKLRRFENEIDALFPGADNSLNTGNIIPEGLDRVEHHSLEAAAFSSSLLAAMNPHLQAQHVSPKTVTEEVQASVECAQVE